MDEINHVRFLMQQVNPEPAHVALIILIELKIPSRCHGFHCLQKALVARSNAPAPCRTEDIYAAIARELGGWVTPHMVELAIACAIFCGWMRKDTSTWKRYSLIPDTDTPRMPSNQEFIARLGYIMYLAFRTSQS